MYRRMIANSNRTVPQGWIQIVPYETGFLGLDRAVIEFVPPENDFSTAESIQAALGVKTTQLNLNLP